MDWTIPLKQLVSKIKTRKGLTLNITCFIDEKDSNVSFFGKHCIVWLLRHISHPMQILLGLYRPPNGGDMGGTVLEMLCM